MPTATVDGITLAYETIGEGRPWVITPGGRFTKDEPGRCSPSTSMISWLEFAVPKNVQVPAEC